MPILISPPRGRGKPVYTTVEHTSKVSSEPIIEFQLDEDEYNYDVVRSINRRWSVSKVWGPDDDTEYLVFMIDRQSVGNKQQVSITCRYKPIDIIKRRRIYAPINGSFKPEKFLDIAFKDSGLNYRLTEKLPSSEFENAGEGETVEELIKKAMAHWDLEFDIEFDKKTKKYTFVFVPYLQKRANYQIDNEINANALKVEEDSGEMATYIRGYGDYTDEQGMTGAGLIMKFEHPDAKDIGYYHGEPIKDGRIKDEELMKAKLQKAIDDSIKRSISLDFIVLNKHYPNAIPKVADIVKVRHSVLGLNEFVRIVEVKTTLDLNNVIINQEVTLGDYKRYDRYMNRISIAANAIGGLGGGEFVRDYRTNSAITSSILATTIKMDKESNASSDKAGLMSAEDKKKLDSIDTSSKLTAKKVDGTIIDLSGKELTIDENGNLKIKEVNDNA
ncbi:tail tube TT1 domain-containing protein [Staphylococcus hominis]|uniref:tail tube TT1 domain-containing protein n=1 Tax=Staphylococcus hominis TaxID=1290 RepID=UPI0011A90B3A|nr:phage tail protein [Staphylococcus hominis]